MGFDRAAVIAGVYEHPTRWAPEKTAYQIHAESARGALADAGLTIRDVDGFATSGVGPLGVMTVAEHLDLSPRYFDSTSIGGSSFVAHVGHAAAAIRSGLCDVCLITYGSTASSDRFAVGTGGAAMSDPPDQFEVRHSDLDAVAHPEQRHQRRSQRNPGFGHRQLRAVCGHPVQSDAVLVEEKFIAVGKRIDPDGCGEVPPCDRGAVPAHDEVARHENRAAWNRMGEAHVVYLCDSRGDQRPVERAVAPLPVVAALE